MEDIAENVNQHPIEVRKGSRARKPKTVFSPDNYFTAKEIKKLNVAEQKKRAKSDQKLIKKSKLDVEYQYDDQNAKLMVANNFKPQNDPTNETVRDEVIISEVMISEPQDNEFFQICNKGCHIKITELEAELVREREENVTLINRNRVLEEDNIRLNSEVGILRTTQVEINDKLDAIKDGVSILTERNREEVEATSARSSISTEPEMRVVAGIAIEKFALERAENATELGARLRHIIKGYWKPSEYKSVASTRPPDEVTKEKMIVLKDKHADEILNIKDEAHSQCLTLKTLSKMTIEVERKAVVKILRMKEILSMMIIMKIMMTIKRYLGMTRICLKKMTSKKKNKMQLK
ncbi:uncharacterized protein LOC127285565 isoform X4 [Leptopilina boulardi]|uniref:uncharacterized protein LOC127285565 isoform X4 n=1 Tax=Leptopilina boulardi TaxID=63433 RepID=UPI0021F64EE4|nr:uncharacterized protein LOC127285565 isoform X4 [Leptopilina boulardi]XP_051167619.1 uncharacterized protein LOC127285565 isoform X4 [Leptopilina boulardi]